MWARVDDGFWCHSKVMGVPLAARGLWVSALSWSCAQRSAVVPTHFLSMLGASTDDADALVSAGLWDPCPEGWEIHDWAEYQELYVSEKRAEAGRRGGQRSGEARRSKPKQNDRPTSTDAPPTAKQAEASDEAGTHPIPAHPIPAPAPSHISGQPPLVEPAPSPVDEQQVRKTAAKIGHAIAAMSAATNPPAYAAKVTAEILTGPDTDQRDRIEARLAAGETPDAIAADWTLAPPPRHPAAPLADPAALEAAREAAARREAETADLLAQIREQPAKRMSRAELRALRSVPDDGTHADQEETA